MPTVSYVIEELTHGKKIAQSVRSVNGNANELILRKVDTFMEHEIQYNTLDELIAAMRAADLLGFEYRTHTVFVNGFTVAYQKYIITIVNNNQ